jgi:hypothetical protein
MLPGKNFSGPEYVRISAVKKMWQELQSPVWFICFYKHVIPGYNRTRGELAFISGGISYNRPQARCQR